jgi:DNA-binding NarL/FixJ family response regulator
MILIADDNASIREGIKTLLAIQRPEWRLYGEAASGEEALESACTLKPDIVLLDMSMPGKTSGVEAALRISRLPFASSVVLLSAEDANVLRALIGTTGAQAFVDKSNVTRDLIPTIERILEGRKLISQLGSANP